MLVFVLLGAVQPAAARAYATYSSLVRHTHRLGSHRGSRGSDVSSLFLRARGWGARYLILLSYVQYVRCVHLYVYHQASCADWPSNDALLLVVRFLVSIAKCGHLLLTQEGPTGMTLTECPGTMTGRSACPPRACLPACFAYLLTV